MDVFILETSNPQEFRVVATKDLDIPDPILPALYRLKKIRKHFEKASPIFNEFEDAADFANFLKAEAIENGESENPSTQVIAFDLPFVLD